MRSSGDQLEHYNISSGNGYHVGAYFASVAGAMHMLCATEDRIKVDWPSRAREHFFQKQQRSNIIQSVVETVAGTRRGFSSAVFAADIISSLADIISPNVRLVGAALATLSAAEQEDLIRVEQGAHAA